MNIRNDLINEICAENNITVDYLSADYILRLAKNGRPRHIFGPYWDLNSAAADRLACDKAGCYTMLNHSGIPSIEHKIMYNPLRWSYLLDESGTMANALAYFEANNRKVVVKPNKGAQGRDVFFCDTALALETAMQTIFTTEPDIALCPYHEIYTEYRVFYLNGRACYVYGKTKGDDWKHNLSQGAKAFEINDGNLRAKLAELAIQAAKCININFATIDIAALEKWELAVMEINSGVQAQYLLQQLPHRRQTIKSIYSDAIAAMFGTGE
ncbi:MAG: ATP-grasp domain-containing protein [Defluviitaleaceae bacterium]|nr:ATP-grasp domain-containing protein [Defluviitaleaceae bacterium]